jgi:hypothetical protein
VKNTGKPSSNNMNIATIINSGKKMIIIINANSLLIIKLL